MRDPDCIMFRELVSAPPERFPHRVLRHPVFQWLGLRPIIAQHTRLEGEALSRWAAGRRHVVEIGVAGGASALELRRAMAAEGTLYLIDPFHLSRIKWINSARRAAGAAVSRSRNGKVVWIEKLSVDAARGWSTPIDFLFIDGDHNEEAVRRDWETWHRFIVTGGCVVFHDAREFQGGWPVSADGPVRVVNSLFKDRRVRGWAVVEETHSLVIVKRTHSAEDARI
jgi:predicted O-methyltransferase YrrM